MLIEDGSLVLWKTEILDFPLDDFVDFYVTIFNAIGFFALLIKFGISRATTNASLTEQIRRKCLHKSNEDGEEFLTMLPSFVRDRDMGAKWTVPDTFPLSFFLSLPVIFRCFDSFSKVHMLKFKMGWKKRHDHHPPPPEISTLRSMRYAGGAHLIPIGYPPLRNDPAPPYSPGSYSTVEGDKFHPEYEDPHDYYYEKPPEVKESSFDSGTHKSHKVDFISNLVELLVAKETSHPSNPTSARQSRDPTKAGRERGEEAETVGNLLNYFFIEH